MSKYVENNLNKGEEIVLKAKKSIWAIMPKIVAVLVWVVVLIVAKVALNKLPAKLPEDANKLITIVLLVPIAIAVLQLLIQMLVISGQNLAVTNKRVFGKVGVLSIKALDYPIEKVDSVSLSASFFGNIFHYHTVIVKSGNDSTEVKFTGIANANEFKNEVTNAIEKHAEDARKAQAEEIAKAMAAAK